MNSFGTLFRITLWGESHGPQVGVTLDGVPAGLPLDIPDFEADLARRRSGAKGTTPRQENDLPQIVSGLYKGHTTGAPLTLVFENANTRSGDYDNLLTQPRPSHADRTAAVKFEGWNDPRGGGHFSGRLTLALVAAGVVAKKILGGATFSTRLTAVGGQTDPARFDDAIDDALRDEDSVGGIVECRVAGIPAGWGEPFFDSVESAAAHLLFAIPAIKGVEFGDGFAAAALRGSAHNDPIADADGRTATNHAGGIAGGITNGNELIVRAAVKPTASIAREQQTFDFAAGRVAPLRIRGRHDACIALRAAVVVEAAMAVALADFKLLDRIRRAIAPLYEPREAEQIARRFTFERCGITLTQYVVAPEAQADIPDLEESVRQLAAGRPVQYVLAHTEFCGMTFEVGEGVLIPRPETEELVAAAAAGAVAGAAALDVGTGSGCIAVSLARLIPDARVTAVDLSPQALAVARRNAVRLGAEVRFVQADALAGLHELPDAAFDLIVSNPPYVPQSDRAAMHVNVRDYEPPEALFVPDDDPLRFYRAIGRAARRLLRPDGRLWFEIYERLADETARLLADEGFGDIAVRRDINDKPRILCCTARK